MAIQTPNSAIVNASSDPAILKTDLTLATSNGGIYIFETTKDVYVTTVQENITQQYVTQSYNNVTNYAAGANGELQFSNGNGNFVGDTELTYDTGSDTLYANNTISAGNIRTNNLLYANGESWDFGSATYGNAQVAVFLSNAATFGALGGTIAARNLIMAGGTSNLGPVSTVSITGGSTGQILTTDGAGNLTWSTITSGSTISNGNSGISVISDGNVTVSANGNNTGVFTSTGANILGYLTSTGDVTAPNFIGTLANGTSNVRVANSGNVNISSGGANNVVSVSATGATVTGTLTVTGNVVSNVIGNVTGNLIGSLSNGNSNITIAGNSNVAVSIAGTANILLVTPNGATVTGVVTANSFSGPLVSGNSNVSIVSSGGNAGTVTISAIGTANVLTVNGTGITVNGTETVTGNTSVGVNLTIGANTPNSALILTGTNSSNSARTITVYPGSNITGNYSLVLPVDVGTSGQLLSTDGNGNLSWASISSSTISNGNSNVNIGTANGNVTISSAGNANIITATGSNVILGNGVGLTLIANNGTNLRQVNIKASNANTFTANYSLTLPVNDGSNSGQALLTDGTGVLSWNFPSQLANGNSNVILAANGNLSVSIAGSDDVLVVSDTGTTVSNLMVAGNLTVNGTQITTNTASLAIQDSIIDLSTGANNAPLFAEPGKDRGLEFNFYNNTTVTKTASSNTPTGNTTIPIANTTGIVAGMSIGAPNAAVFASDTTVTTVNASNIVISAALTGTLQTTANIVIGTNLLKFMGWDYSNAEFGFGSNVTNANDIITFGSYGNTRAKNYITDVGGALVVTSNANGTARTVTINGSTDANFTGSYTLTLPVDDGTSGQVLATDGTGKLGWASVGTGAAISNGTSSVNIPVADGPITIAVSNIGNVAVFDATRVQIGQYAGNANSANYSIAIGAGASVNAAQSANAIAVGSSAGANGQGANSVAIGLNAGGGTNVNAVSLGANAGKTSQGANTVAIGVSAGANNQSTAAISIGNAAGVGNSTAGQGVSSVAIGDQAAGNTSGNTQAANAIAVGTKAGYSAQAANSVAIGNNAGFSSQSDAAIAIGVLAGNASQGMGAVAIGGNAASKSQGLLSIAIGQNAAMGNSSAGQGQQSIAIGDSAAGNNTGTTQSANSIAIGTAAAFSAQGTNSIAIGQGAANTTQGANSVAIGTTAAGNAQGTNSIAIGANAGSNTQSANSIAIGTGAGANVQGTNSIAIGTGAGANNQVNNSIVINATGSNIDGDAAGFHVAPVRLDNTSNANVLFYNTTTNEITYTPASTSLLPYQFSGDTGSSFDVATQAQITAVLPTYPLPKTGDYFVDTNLASTNQQPIYLYVNGQWRQVLTAVNG